MKNILRLSALRKPKSFFIIVMIVLGFAAMGVATAWLLNGSRQSQQNTSPPKLERSAADIAGDKALGLAASGKTEEAVKGLDESISATDDASQKAEMLSAKATVYLNKGDTDNALKFAKEAFDTASNASIAGLIAQIYEQKGDSANAASYYRKAAASLDKNNPLYDEDKQYYEARASELERS